MKKVISILTLTVIILAGCAQVAVPTAAPAPTAAPTPTTTMPDTATPILSTPTPVPPTVTPTVPPTPAPSNSQVIWDKSYDKQQNDLGEDVLLVEDGGGYIVGTANLDFSGAGALSDIYLIRTDADGEVLWDKTYGGEQSDEGLSITWTSDGNLLLAGATRPSGAGGVDVYLLKVDPEGNELWAQTFASPLDEMVSVRALADGGFMLWGNSVDPNDPVADPGAAGYGGFAGRSNIYLAKVDAAGNQVWTQTFGGQNNLLASAGLQTADGGFLVLASLLRFPDPGDDLYLLKVDAAGDLVWEHTWEEGTMAAYDLIHTADDNYLIAGLYIPTDNTAPAKADFLFIRVDEQGDELWRNVFGNPDMIDYPQVVAETPDGGYLAAGEWVKDWSGRHPASIAIAKIDANGQPLWQEVIKNGSSHSMLRTMLRHPDGSYRVVGSKLKGQQFDIFLMKVDIGDSLAYLGQTPPDLTPQVFAPEIVSIPDAADYAGSFSPDGTEFYFTRGTESGQNLYEAHLSNGVWSAPAPVAFSAGYDAHEPHVTFDNQTLYFGWFRPLPPEEESAEEYGIWATDRTAGGWSEPRYVGAGMAVSSDRSGQLYVTDFKTRRVGQVGLADGRFTDWQSISTGAHPCIAPDGSYLIYDRDGTHMYIRFRLADGAWGAQKDLTQHGFPVKSGIASISPDGQYLFYGYQGDLYWVSTALITQLKDR